MTKITDNFEKLTQVIQEAVSDELLSPEEKKHVTEAFDLNGDGILTSEDVAQISADRFGAVSEVLAKHGIKTGELFGLPPIKVSKFSDYQPQAAGSQLNFSDPLMAYFFQVDSGDGSVYQYKKGGIKKNIYQLKDAAQFKKDVLQVALKLGFTEEKLKSLSIHDAIMLSGQIVSEQLEYHHGMIGKDEEEFAKKMQKDPKAALVEMLLTDKDLRSDEAKKIDTMPVDELFSGKKGICRNYAPLNMAVFDVLKKLNPGLKNTSMTVVGNSNHAWNQVATLTTKSVEVTYVDPTWLDTRSRTARSDLDKVEQEGSDLSFYDAVDELHLRQGFTRLDEMFAELFQIAADPERALGQYTKFPSSVVVLRSYGERAFNYFSDLVSKKADRLRFYEQAENREMAPSFRDGVIKDFYEGIASLNEEQLSVALLIKYPGQYPLSEESKTAIKKTAQQLINKWPQALDYKVLVLGSQDPISIRDILKALGASL